MGGSQSKPEENEADTSTPLVNIEVNRTEAQLADKSLIEVSIFNIFRSNPGNQ